MDIRDRRVWQILPGYHAEMLRNASLHQVLDVVRTLLHFNIPILNQLSPNGPEIFLKVELGRVRLFWILLGYLIFFRRVCLVTSTFPASTRSSLLRGQTARVFLIQSGNHKIWNWASTVVQTSPRKHKRIKTSFSLFLVNTTLFDQLFRHEIAGDCTCSTAPSWQANRLHLVELEQLFHTARHTRCLQILKKEKNCWTSSCPWQMSTKSDLGVTQNWEFEGEQDEKERAKSLSRHIYTEWQVSHSCH